jgi:hypothetical protein
MHCFARGPIMLLKRSWIKYVINGLKKATISHGQPRHVIDRTIWSDEYKFTSKNHWFSSLLVISNPFFIYEILIRIISFWLLYQLRHKYSMCWILSLNNFHLVIMLILHLSNWTRNKGYHKYSYILFIPWSIPIGCWDDFNFPIVDFPFIQHIEYICLSWYNNQQLMIRINIS